MIMLTIVQGIYIYTFNLTYLFPVSGPEPLALSRLPTSPQSELAKA
jgi:hypothetical protein